MKLVNKKSSTLFNGEPKYSYNNGLFWERYVKENTMKKLSALMLLGLVLTGCGATQTNNSETQQSETTTVAEKVSADKLFASVIEDYKKLLAGIKPNVSFSTNEVVTAISAMKIPVHDWVGTIIFENKDGFRYAFYDIDGNETDELLTAMQGASEEMSLLGVYYIADDAPKLLAEGYAGSAARAGIVIYKDGTILSSKWSSRNGKGVSTLYELQKDNTEAKNLKTEEDIRINIDVLNTAFGKTNEGILKLENLKWKKVEMSPDSVSETTKSNVASKSAETTKSSTARETVETTAASSSSTIVETKQPTPAGMNVAAIQSGDFSSIAGNWYSASGDSFTLSGGTFASKRGSWTISNMGAVDGLASLTLKGVMPSAPIYVLVPAGQSIPGYTSDVSQDRIYLRPQYKATQTEFEQYIYYKQ